MSPLGATEGARRQLDWRSGVSSLLEDGQGPRGAIEKVDRTSRSKLTLDDIRHLDLSGWRLSRRHRHRLLPTRRRADFVGNRFGTGPVIRLVITRSATVPNQRRENAGDLQWGGDEVLKLSRLASSSHRLRYRPAPPIDHRHSRPCEVHTNYETHHRLCWRSSTVSACSKSKVLTANTIVARTNVDQNYGDHACAKRPCSCRRQRDGVLALGMEMPRQVAR